MQLIANIRLNFGRGQIVEPGQAFDELSPRAAQQLIRSGKAFSVDAVSAVHYETKIVTPEVKLGGDAEPAALAAIRRAIELATG